MVATGCVGGDFGGAVILLEPLVRKMSLLVVGEKVVRR